MRPKRGKPRTPGRSSPSVPRDAAQAERFPPAQPRPSRVRNLTNSLFAAFKARSKNISAER